MVVGHEASLSGAPVLLLHLFRLVKENNIASFFFVLRRDGPLVDEYKNIAEVIVLKTSKYSIEKQIFKRLCNILINRFTILKVLIKGCRCDCIFSNTIINGSLLKTLSILNKPIITYVHELQHIIDFFIDKKEAKYTLKLTSVFAFPSVAVRNVLVNNYCVSNDKLKKLSYYFPVKKQIIDEEQAASNSAFRKKFGFKEDDLIIGGMGLASKRKGVDLFIEVCELVIAQNKKIRFCWVGNYEDLDIQRKTQELIAEKNLSENILFTGPLPHNLNNFSFFNLFFLSSREDPYPLVVLEAAIMKVPSICFSDSGGIVEFIEKDAGWIIEDFSVKEASTQILSLAQNKEQILQVGNAAFEKVIKLHCTPEVIVREFKEMLLA
jgi:glycosyltransferase involved in cell wall biosynthesis